MTATIALGECPVASTETAVRIVVYTKPDCVQCNATYRALNRAGLPYETVNISQDTEALEWVKSLGHAQAPVVIVNGKDHWSGYRPDRIKMLAAAAA